MQAIRQFVTVKNHQINITLPDDFNAEEVEVIILPASKEIQIPQWQIDEVRERTENYLKDPSTALDFDEVMKEIEEDFELTDEMKAILDERLNEPTDNYLTAEESLARIRKKYDL